MKRLLLTALTVMASVGVASATGAHDWRDHDWRDKVPAKQRAVQNPYSSDPDTLKAGASIYKERCAQCHANDALGRGRRPGLRPARVQNATDGELLWLLNNGEIRYGMPGWSDLPGEQRWQVERYIKSLPIAPPPR